MGTSQRAFYKATIPEAIDILLTSVPHSATRFFKELVRPDVVWHVDDQRIDQGMAMARIKVCAVRRPEAVWRSWFRRDEADPAKWERCWRQLDELTKRYDDVAFVSVDADRRDEYLDFLAGRLNRHILTLWEPVGHFAKAELANQPVPAIDVNWIYEIPIMKQLYRRSS